MGALSTTGFSSQTQTAALLIWVMTHEIISSKRSEANDYFLLIDWNPIIFLMLSIYRKLCPSDTKKNDIYIPQSRVMLSTFHWDKPNHVATQSALFSPPSLPLAPLCAPVHVLHLFCFCYGSSSVGSAHPTPVFSPLSATCMQWASSAAVLVKARTVYVGDSVWEYKGLVLLRQLGTATAKMRAACCN